MAERTKAKVLYFSSRENVPQGAFVVDGNIVFGTPEKNTVICKADELYIPGEHNLQNALAACAMAMVMNVQPAIIRHTFRTFEGVEHRIEFVCEKNGIAFINDSKGTNVDSSLRAVRAMTRPTVIILGGYDKHCDFTPLCEEMLNCPIVHAVLIGDTAKQFDETLRKVGFTSFEHAGYDFKAAIERAYKAAPEGGCALLSPSCASFDMFKDYEERGRVFKKLASELQ